VSVTDADAAGLAAIVEAGGPTLRTDLEAVERQLAGVLGSYAPLIAEPAAGTIAAGGKRLRPLLVLIAADRSGAEAPLPDTLLRAAASVELIHAASLVHDDVLDRADLRRGRPTVVASSGRDMAIAAGDLLFSRAFAVLAVNRDTSQLRALSSASSALARGELLQREDAYNAAVSVERYLLRCECKTARLFEAACRLGVLAGQATRDAAGAGSLADELAPFGVRMGLAFQLLDDVLDVSGPAERTGKPRGADLLDGTVTLPLILARERDPVLAATDLRSVADPADAAEICRRIEQAGALDQAREMAWGMVAAAKSTLGARLGRARREALERVADSVVARYA
jgi:geranylgeranyl pyrophosphate synthase